MKTHHTAASASDRLEALERKAERFRTITLVSTMLLGVIVLTGFAVPERGVRATRFVLEDKLGQERGVFGVDEHGNTFLRLMNERGVPTLNLLAGSKASTVMANNLWIVDGQDRARGWFGINVEAGTIDVGFHDKNGATFLKTDSWTLEGPRDTIAGGRLAIDDGGSVQLCLRNERGDQTNLMPNSFVMNDPNESTKVALFCGEDSPGTLMFLDPNQASTCRALLGLGKDGSPILTLTGNEGDQRIALGKIEIDGDECHGLQVRDENGRNVLFPKK